METIYKIRNKQTGRIYIDNAKSFGEAIAAARFIKSNDLEMVKTTEEIIKNYENADNS